MRHPWASAVAIAVTVLLAGSSVAVGQQDGPTGFRPAPATMPPASPAVRVAPPGFGSADPGGDPDTRVYIANILTAVDALDADDAWAVGNIQFVSALLEHWDGHSWQSYPSPGGQIYLNAVHVISPDDAWAVGDRLDTNQNVTVHWDGTTWSVVPSPSLGYNSSLESVSGTGPDDVWAVGTYTAKTPHVPLRTLALHWDGTSWQRFHTPSPGRMMSSFLYGVTTVSPDDVWAVGSYYYIQFGRDHSLAEHWDGRSWSRARKGNPGNTDDDVLFAVSANVTDDVMAVGVHDTPHYGYPKPLAMTWNGTRWSHVYVTQIGRFPKWFYGVSAAGGGDYWAVGQKEHEPGPGYHALTAEWDGGTWRAHTSRSPGLRRNTALFGVSMVSPAMGFAVGYYENASGADTPFAERWTGGRWVTDPLG